MFKGKRPALRTVSRVTFNFCCLFVKNHLNVFISSCLLSTGHECGQILFKDDDFYKLGEEEKVVVTRNVVAALKLCASPRPGATFARGGELVSFGAGTSESNEGGKPTPVFQKSRKRRSAKCPSLVRKAQPSTLIQNASPAPPPGRGPGAQPPRCFSGLRCSGPRPRLRGKRTRTGVK